LSESRFDRTADRYARAAAAKDWSRLVDLCRPSTSDRALDVGAGPGMFSAALAPHVARAVALDPSAALLAHAPDAVERAVGTGEDIPFPDGSFDLVTVVNTLHHVDDMRATLAEMVRVLAPGGRIVVQDYLADDDPAAAARWETVERLRDPDHRRLPRRGEVAAALVPHGLAVDEEREWRAAWDLEPWLEMAGTPDGARARVRELVGAARFETAAWMARFAPA
jgi:SAM-dependent methyltransferase